MSTLTWLHFSDLHFTADLDWRTDPVLQSFIRDVLETLPDRGLKPDLIFFTGDLAWSGQEAQYKKAQPFLEKVAEITNVDPSQGWFIVPGNHDVDRSLILRTAWKQFPNDDTELNELLNSATTFEFFDSSRQSAFRNFVDTFTQGQRAFFPDRPWRTDTIKLNNLTLAILSLNSAWAAGREDERGKLLLGEL